MDRKAKKFGLKMDRKVKKVGLEKAGQTREKRWIGWDRNVGRMEMLHGLERSEWLEWLG